MSSARMLVLTLIAACSSSSSPSATADGAPGAPDASLGAVRDARRTDAQAPHGADAPPVPGADAPAAPDGGTCGVSLDSCLTVSCCTGFMCCVGNPIPPGEARCYPGTCPD